MNNLHLSRKTPLNGEAQLYVSILSLILSTQVATVWCANSTRQTRMWPWNASSFLGALESLLESVFLNLGWAWQSEAWTEGLRQPPGVSTISLSLGTKQPDEDNSRKKTLNWLTVEEGTHSNMVGRHGHWSSRLQSGSREQTGSGPN